MKTRRSARGLLLAALLLMSILLPGCVARQAENKEAPTDYAVAANWLAMPDTPDKPVDVFYLYPTAWHKESAEEPNICTVDNATLRETAPEMLRQQASVFEPVANVYAPYYRQADAAYCLGLSHDEEYALLNGVPKIDVFAAFDYYLEHENNGRPFILAGHSQGSNMLLYLLGEYMKAHPVVYRRMVAAYVIGYSVTGDYLAQNPHLRFAEAADDTGVIISYNTEAPGVTADNPVLLPGAKVINPISWTRDETLAPAEQSLGSASREDPSVKSLPSADARIDKVRGVLICDNQDTDALAPGNAVFPEGVYHGYDYAFYYYNLRENAGQRIEAYLARR